MRGHWARTVDECAGDGTVVGSFGNSDLGAIVKATIVGDVCSGLGATEGKCSHIFDVRDK